MSTDSTGLGEIKKLRHAFAQFFLNFLTLSTPLSINSFTHYSPPIESELKMPAQLRSLHTSGLLQKQPDRLISVKHLTMHERKTVKFMDKHLSLLSFLSRSNIDRFETLLPQHISLSTLQVVCTQRDANLYRYLSALQIFF